MLFFRKRVADIYPLTFRKKARIRGWRVGNKELKIGEKLSFDEQFPLPITGEFEFALGDLGNDQEPNANDVLILKDGEGIIINWDATAERYLGTDLEFTTYMNTIFVPDEELCVSVAYLPVLLIHYDFSTLQLGAAS